MPLVTVNVLGRAVRIYGDFFSICHLCGALAKLSPAHRFGGSLCCLRCDFKMLYGEKADAEEEAKRPKPPPLSCRFCGKVQAAGSTAWRILKAPADSGGANATVPPPLRKVSYCPTHFRAWLQTAHLTMHTSLIFSHLMTKAKPIFGAARADEKGPSVQNHNELVVAAPKRKKTNKLIDKRIRSNARRKNKRV